MTTINITTQLQTEECCNCHMLFAITAEFQSKRRNDHETFFCPAGHRQYYGGKSVEEKLKAQLAAQEQQLRDSVHAEELQRARAAKIEKQLKKVQAEAKRVTTRITAGVCPCCNRTFKQLAAHMKNKHPEHVAEAA